MIFLKRSPARLYLKGQDRNRRNNSHSFLKRDGKERDIRTYFCSLLSASSREPEMVKIFVNPAISKTCLTCGERDERMTIPPVLRIERVMRSSTLSPALAIYSVFEKSKRTRFGHCAAIFFNSSSIAGALSASNRRTRGIMIMPSIVEISRAIKIPVLFLVYFLC